MEELFELEEVKKRAPNTIHDYHNFISMIFYQAEKEMLVMFNPVEKASSPKNCSQNLVERMVQEVSYADADFLPHGSANAVPSRHLADLLGFRSVRDLQKVIERERNAGAVILSTGTDGGGYFLPDCPDEIKRFNGLKNKYSTKSVKNIRYRD